MIMPCLTLIGWTPGLLGKFSSLLVLLMDSDICPTEPPHMPHLLFGTLPVEPNSASSLLSVASRDPGASFLTPVNALPRNVATPRPPHPRGVLSARISEVAPYAPVRYYLIPFVSSCCPPKCRRLCLPLRPPLSAARGKVGRTPRRCPNCKRPY